MIKEVLLPSGNKAMIGDPAFEDVLELQEYIARNANNIPAEAFSSGLGEDIVSLIKFLPSLIENKEFRAIVFKCGAKCKIKRPNGDMVDFEMAYFNAPEARPDYFVLIKEVVEFSLLPLFKGLRAVSLKDLFKKMGG